MTPFAIAGIQASIATHENNVPRLLHRVDECMARFPWVQMLVLSELAAHGPGTSMAEAPGGASEHAFCKAARKHGIWLVAGSLFERADDGRIYNVTPVIDPSGHVVTRYRKMFPFYPYEHDVSPGLDFCVFDVPGAGRFGVSICYDIWFPETTRMLTALGAEVLLHPSLTNTIDRSVELAMVRATAAQFQLYVLDINGVGDGGVGRSCIADPAGTVLHEAGSGPELMPIEVDFDVVRRQRQNGLHGLGQPLKSFRDTPARFPVYQADYAGPNHWHELGPLALPERAGGVPGQAPHAAHRDDVA